MERRQLLKLLGAAGLPAAWPAAARAGYKGPGRPARAILVISGDYYQYRRRLIGLASGLYRAGLLARNFEPDPAYREDVRDVWRFLASDQDNDRLVFLPDGLYNYAFSEDKRKKVREEILARIAGKKDVSLVLAFGTDATLDMARGVDDIPVLGLGSTDPVLNGIIKSADDSGKDNVHSIVFEGQFARQTTAFHKLYPFKKLALLTVEERKNRAGMADVWSACNQIGAQFELVSYREGDSHEEHFANLMAAVDKVVECGADAVMIPFLKITDDKFPVFLRKLVSHHIASFSQEGEFHVSRGILLGLGEDSLEPYGMFEAGVIERVLVGETPRGIDQRFLPAHRWLINLRTGIQLGWKPPFGLILTAGKIYSTQSPLLPR